MIMGMIILESCIQDMALFFSSLNDLYLILKQVIAR